MSPVFGKVHHIPKLRLRRTGKRDFLAAPQRKDISPNGFTQKRRKAKIAKHKRRKRMKENRHKKRLRYKS